MKVSESEQSNPRKKLSALSDPGKYKLAKELTARCWAPMVWKALDQARVKSTQQICELELAVWNNCFEIIANQAIWASTEIHRDKKWKYFAQPHVTEKASFQVNLKRSSDLRHEHILERKGLVESLRQARNEAEIAGILGDAVSCVVTKEEDTALREAKRRYANEERYWKAKILIPHRDGPPENWGADEVDVSEK